MKDYPNMNWIACLGIAGFVLLATSMNPSPLAAPDDAMAFPPGEKGDLWILAGQSNMQGAGLLKDEPAGDSRLFMFNMDNRWMPAALPDHRIFESVAPVHRILLNKSDEEFARLAAQSRQKPLGGVGPGFFFGRELARALDRPIGLIPCAHGGTSMAQWSPDQRAEGGRSLYGAMIERVEMIGGRVKGIVWYQGESDAQPGVADAFEDNFLNFVDAVRRDTGVPDLPFLYVQIATFAIPDPNGQGGLNWEKVREAQRRAAAKRPNLWMVSALDLPHDDYVHIAYEGHERLGKRLAELALGKVYGLPGRATPIDLESVAVVQEPKGRWAQLRVRFTGVNGHLRADGRPTGFTLRSSREGAGPAPIVYRIDVDPADPAALLLYLNHEAPLKPGPWQLIYGAGINPYVNITDEKDMPVPGFGPVDIPFD